MIAALQLTVQTGGVVRVGFDGVGRPAVAGVRRLNFDSHGAQPVHRLPTPTLSLQLVRAQQGSGHLAVGSTRSQSGREKRLLLLLLQMPPSPTVVELPPPAVKAVFKAQELQDRCPLLLLRRQRSTHLLPQVLAVVRAGGWVLVAPALLGVLLHRCLVVRGQHARLQRMTLKSLRYVGKERVPLACALPGPPSQMSRFVRSLAPCHPSVLRACLRTGCPSIYCR